MGPNAILFGLLLFAPLPMLSWDVEVKAPPGVVCRPRQARVREPSRLSTSPSQITEGKVLLPEQADDVEVGVDCEGPDGLRWSASVFGRKAGTRLVADVTTLGFIKVSVSSGDRPGVSLHGDLYLKDADGRHSTYSRYKTIRERTNSPHTYVVRAGSYAAAWRARNLVDVAVMDPYCSLNLTVKPGRVATFACDITPGSLRVDVTDSRGGAVDAHVTVVPSSEASIQVELLPPPATSRLPAGMARRVYPGRYDLLVTRRDADVQIRIPGVRIEPRKEVRFARKLDLAELFIDDANAPRIFGGDEYIDLGPDAPIAPIAARVGTRVLAGQHQLVRRRYLDDGCTSTSRLWVSLKPGEGRQLRLRPPPVARLQLRATCDGEACADDVTVQLARTRVRCVNGKEWESGPVVWGVPSEGVELSISPGVHHLVAGVGALMSKPIELRVDADRCSALNVTAARGSVRIAPTPSECEKLRQPAVDEAPVERAEHTSSGAAGEPEDDSEENAMFWQMMLMRVLDEKVTVGPSRATNEQVVPRLGKTINVLATLVSIKSTGTDTYEISKEEFTTVLNNLNDLAMEVRIIPVSMSRGASGFKLLLSPDSLFTKIGIQNGDLIRRINGFDFNSAEESLRFYAELKEANRIEIEIDRNGSPVRTTLNVR